MNIFGKKNNVIIENDSKAIAIRDISTQRISIGKGQEIKLTKLFPQKTFVYDNSRMSQDFESVVVPEDNFNTIEKAIDTEGYLNRSIDRFVEMIWKSGFEFIGDDEAAVKYIQKRFKEMSLITKKPTITFFEEITREFIGYANVFLYKKRSSSITSGRKTKQYGVVLDPIAFYLMLKTANVYVRTNKYNLIENYVYEIPKYDKTFYLYKYINIQDSNVCLQPYDIVHMYYNKKASSYYGKPNISSVLNDARSLRRMEENVEILVFQHTIPLIHCSIGTDSSPSEENEIIKASNTFQDMLTEGMITTSHRHKIEIIGKNNSSLDVLPYLEYFKNRMLAGVGQSKISIGESGDANKASAQVLNDAIIDMANRYKKNIQAFVESEIIYDLLLEGGFNPFLVSVSLFIPEISVALKYKEEYQTMQLFQGGLLNEDEARKKIGKKALTIKQRKKMYYSLNPKATTTPESNSNEIATQLDPENQYTD